MEPQQSPLYSEYMKRIKWDVVEVDGIRIFMRRFPLMGGIAKIHRPPKLPSLSALLPVLESRRIRRLVLEPDALEPQDRIRQWVRGLPSWITLNRSPFLPTKTIRIGLTRPPETVFQSFTEAKRRAVRRSVALGVTVNVSQDIKTLISVKNASGGLFGFITTTGIRELWDLFAPKHASILLAYHERTTKPIGGVMLLEWDNVAYYWIAGATREGKKRFAPTLLVWEALKLSKSHGAHEFDFVGVWDERIPQENTSWKGFTKFKEGFGGNTRYYPLLPLV